jgi:hypothetical protein
MFGAKHFLGCYKQAAEQLRKRTRATGQELREGGDECVRHLFQRLGVLLVKGNAALLLNRIPSFPYLQLMATCDLTTLLYLKHYVYTCCVTCLNLHLRKILNLLTKEKNGFESRGEWTNL